jgi:hypothetical protein
LATPQHRREPDWASDDPTVRQRAASRQTDKALEEAVEERFPGADPVDVSWLSVSKRTIASSGRSKSLRTPSSFSISFLLFSMA